MISTTRPSLTFPGPCEGSEDCADEWGRANVWAYGRAIFVLLRPLPHSPALPLTLARTHTCPDAHRAMPDDLIIRRATVDDAETLARFNEAMAAETEDKTLDPDTVRAGVRAVFDKPEQAFYLVAERNGSIVGSLMITTEWSDWRNANFWWIQSVYVRPEARRRASTRRYTARCDDGPATQTACAGSGST